jgi:hypothetical protein
VRHQGERSHIRCGSQPEGVSSARTPVVCWQRSNPSLDPGVRASLGLMVVAPRTCCCSRRRGEVRLADIRAFLTPSGARERVVFTAVSSYAVAYVVSHSENSRAYK